MLDGVHIIERIHKRGSLLKVLDKPHLDLTTPIGRGFIAFLSALAEDERGRIVKRANDGRAAAKARVRLRRECSSNWENLRRPSRNDLQASSEHHVIAEFLARVVAVHLQPTRIPITFAGTGVLSDTSSLLA
jgi:DNA invertase Pin-like site-specific DNA recombinase